MTSAPNQALYSPTPKRQAPKMGSNQNLNHLLNFTLPPRQARPLTNLPRRNRKTTNAQGVWNKERFVNAQYRFVMNPTGDYTVHFADPDIFFQWQDILQVIIPRSSALASAAASGESPGVSEGLTTCPICLSPPTAPRMTKCGHVYCFPCVLHYLNTSEHKWARCPICFDLVNEKELKAVKWYDEPATDHSTMVAGETSSTLPPDDTFSATPRTGSHLRMRLIQRPQITTLALPRSPTWPSDLLPPHKAPWHFLPDIFSFAKFMLATPAYLRDDLSKDLEELANERRMLAGMSDELGVSFIDAAEVKIRRQMAKAEALDTPWLKEQIDKAQREQQGVLDRLTLQDRARNRNEESEATGASQDALLSEEIPLEFLSVNSRMLSAPSRPTPPPTEKEPPPPSQSRNAPRQRRNINPPPPTTSTYYYYQAASGLPLFLHPLDIRILFSHFSAYASFPDIIDVKVEALNEGTVNDDLRKRCKYIAHFPEGADVVFIEADLEGVVGSQGLKNFEQALKMRSAKRKEKEKKDERARVKGEEKEKERERLLTRSLTEPASSVSMETHGLIYDDASLPDSQPHSSGVSPPQQPLYPPPRPQQMSGAWGSRSFASALHSSPSTRAATPRTPQRNAATPREEDSWDLDGAWHELEQNLSVGRKKRGARLVVLGSGAAGSRRR